jgi:CubicO group peptidase (beta-lactamase class C family)
MDAEFAKITLQELLSHSSGLASDGSEILDLIRRSYMQDGNMDEVRYWMVKETAPKPLDHARGSPWHAGEGKRPPVLVSPDIVKKLHTPVIDTGVLENARPGTPKTGKYALGWGQVTVDWAPTPVMTHSGSNGMNLAIAMFWPETDFGFVMMTNIASTPADEALRKLAADLYKGFSGKPAQ